MKNSPEHVRTQERRGAIRPECGAPWRDDIATSAVHDGLSCFSIVRMNVAPVPLPYSQPHRHDFQEIMVIQSGRSHHIIDGDVIDFRPQSVCFIPKDYVHLVEPDAGLTGWMVRFSDDFLPADLIDRNWNYRTALSTDLGPTRTLGVKPPEMRRLELILELMESEYLTPSYFQKQNLRHWLALLITQIARLSRNAPTCAQNETATMGIFQAFLTMLERDFASHHDVRHYADSLNIDPINLSKIVGRVLGKSTKNLIEERVILEAKRNLLYTRLSIKEIAFELGYADQFHFSKTFKRIVGMPPQTFRALNS